MFRHLLRSVCLALAIAVLGIASASSQTPFAAPEAAPAQPTPPDFNALADILEDAASRDALIGELRRLAVQAGQTDAPPAAEDVSAARQIAQITRSVAEGTVHELTEGFRRLVELDFEEVPADGIANLGQAAVDLAGVVVGAILVMYLLRLAASRLYRRASDWVLAKQDDPGKHWLRRGFAVLGCGLVDLVIVIAAWIAGYVVALLLLGDGGVMDTRQSLFLNAFLLIESAKVVVRLFFATRYDGLRLLPLRGEDAAYWNAWLSRMISYVGYGILVLVPIISLNLAPALGHLVTVVIYVIALLNALILVKQNRRSVQARLLAMSDRANFGFTRVSLRFLAGTWHLIIIGYLFAFAAVSLVHPQEALPFIITATVQSAVAIAAGGLVAFLIARFIAFGVHLPEDTRRKFPMLEGRLNAFVPATLQAVRIVVGLVVLALVLDAWRIFDFFAWITSERGTQFLSSVIAVAIILAVAGVLWLVVASWIEQRLAADARGAGRAASARERTLLTIFRNAFTIALVVMASMVALSEIGLDIGPLLAGAGVLGLAIGFGAQRLVQDVITGVFIQLENAMNTGDVVAAGGISGVVEKLTVRSVGIRDLSGTYHLIPFSSVDTVSNFMRGFAYHVGEYGIAYRENLDEVVEVLKAAFVELRDGDLGVHIIDELEVHGITEFADSSVVVRIRIKTMPGQQWGVGRAYNGLVKKHFDAAGIEIPFPHVTLYFGEDKQGKAPPASLRMLDAPAPEKTEKKPRQRARGAARGRSRTRPGPSLPDIDEGPQPNNNS